MPLSSAHEISSAFCCVPTVEEDTLSLDSFKQDSEL